LQDGDAAAEAPEHLTELQPDVTAPDQKNTVCDVNLSRRHRKKGDKPQSRSNQGNAESLV
jgi:hypothetical protein